MDEDTEDSVAGGPSTDASAEPCDHVPDELVSYTLTTPKVETYRCGRCGDLIRVKGGRIV